jgi:dTDP-4-amino-4,6-dideoxygalactose transaminase
MSAETPIKFVDLPAQYADIEKDILAAVADLVHKGAFVGGPALAEFEAALAKYCGVKFAVGCSDGTMALVLSLRAAGLRAGDGVVVPANTFIASANAVVHAGGRPVLVDCDPQTYLIDLHQAEAALKAGRAHFLMPVHLYGNPCPMREVVALADRYGAKVIEDNAQAIGATVDGGRTGGFGLAAGISFYPAKNLGAFGQGGAVLTNDEGVAQTVRMYVEQGQGAQRYYHDVVGYNGRLHSLQACVLGKLLPKLDSFNQARLRAADWYAARLDSQRIQKRTPGSTPVYHLFEYRCDDKAQRDRLAAALQAAGVPFAYHYPVPIHKQKAYAEFNHLSLPVAERLAEVLISLPMHPGLAEPQVERVCRLLRSV